MRALLLISKEVNDVCRAAWCAEPAAVAPRGALPSANNGWLRTSESPAMLVADRSLDQLASSTCGGGHPVAEIALMVPQTAAKPRLDAVVVDNLKNGLNNSHKCIAVAEKYMATSPHAHSTRGNPHAVSVRRGLSD